MGRKKLTDEDKEKFRMRLLDAALKLFAEEGYEAVSIRALAARVGCSAMKPYRYFDDKAAIFDACRCRAFEGFAEAQEATAARNINPRERIKALGQAYARYADANPEAFRLMFERSQPNDPSPQLVKSERRAFMTLQRAVEESVGSGLLKGDPKTLAHLYWASLHGVVVLDLAGKLVHGRTKRTILTTLFQGGFTSAGG